MNYLTLLIIILNFNYSYQFQHYKYSNIKSINKCPFHKKSNDCILNKIKLNNNFQKTNLLITYPAWKPKDTYYNPKKVDWSSVISGCHAACNFDKRLCNFYVRAAAHDSLSISEGYGGTDGSMLITEDELNRPENNYDNFAYKLSKNALALAKKYDTSVADIISICGAYAVKYLGGIDIIKSSNKEDPFLVGRKDSIIPNPAHQLVPETANTSQFNDFSIKYNLTLEEFSALLGSHVLLDEKNCLNKDHITNCDPLINKCNDISMFKWDNSYFSDICSKNISIKFNSMTIDIIKSKKQLIKDELCKFTSNYFKDVIKQDIGLELDLNIEQILLQDIITEKNDLVTEPSFIKPIDISYYENNQFHKWLYTINDAWLGQACQNKLENTNYNLELFNSLNKFKQSQYNWELIYSKAYKKMINNNVRWFNLKFNGLQINGKECYSGYKKYKNILICKTAFTPDESYYY
jgi:hypothetical protein